jgi:ABC-type bacteriocin/lantibiotic exporter with double-glycine peptidase domain
VRLEKAKERISKNIGSTKAKNNIAIITEYDANTVQNVAIKKESIFQWFLPSIKKHKKQFLSVIFISIMIQLIMLLTPLLFQYFLDSALPSFNPTNLQTVMIAMLFFALVDPMFLLMRSFAFFQNDLVIEQYSVKHGY